MNKFLQLIDFKIEINLAAIIAFFFGILSGMFLLFFIYVLSSLKAIKKRRIIVSKELKNINDEDIMNIIKLAKEEFHIKKKQHKSISFSDFREIIINLINQIAFRFYPKSKHPIAELSIDELILLDRYLVNQIDSFTSKKGIRLVKKVKISSIITIINTKNTIENTAVIKTIKKDKVDKIATAILDGLQVLNPVLWIRKGIVAPTIKMILNRICLVIISIVGQETYHIYSKKIFTENQDELELIELVKKLSIEEKEKEVV